MALSRDTLLELLACHSTPGEESEVREVLERAWRKAGLRTQRLGEYAICASTAAKRRAPVMLIAAHMDSPGFSADVAPRPGSAAPAARLTPLGHPAFAGARAAGVLATRSGKSPVTIHKQRRSDGTFSYRCTPAPGTRLPTDLLHGDRVCFASAPEMKDDLIHAPFLDNRLGCWMLAELAGRIPAWRSRYPIVLGATSGEELGGFGASVLARHVQPDVAIVIDATYEALDQGVRLGAGPVLTLSDASVLLSRATRDRVRGIFADAKIPLQTEVYNYSGTDARAFPHQGLVAPVLPLLLPTRGNHSPRETADLRDADRLLDGLAVLAERFSR